MESGEVKRFKSQNDSLAANSMCLSQASRCAFFYMVA